MSALGPRSGIQVSSVYPTYTHIKGLCPLCVCVCVCVCVPVCVPVCSQASRSRATLSCDSSYSIKISLLQPKIDKCCTSTWVVPVNCGHF